MAFLFLQALEKGAWEDMHTDRALAMMGTVADLVELKGVNRLMVQQGLRSLQDLRSGPLAALRDNVKTREALTSTDVAFCIAPRLNAAGRMDDPALALHAILEGGAHIERLHQLNQARRSITGDLVDLARADAARRGSLLIASASPDYPHGIIGLIAGALTESSGCPSIVGAEHGDWITASLRSPKNYNVTEGLTRLSHLLHAYGGHRQAAGCTLRKDRWQEVIHALEMDIASCLTRADLCPRIEVDSEIRLRDISIQLVQSLSELEPFGQGNPEPRFLLHNTTITDMRCVGDIGNHLQMRVNGIKGIGFGLGELRAKIDDPMDLICRIGINTWQGKREVQLFVDDVRVAIPVPNSLQSERHP
jgi:single-stranded-DNA-specific exonuclease